LLEKWLTFSQGLRNANHTQTLDLANIYGRFVYEDNLIQRSQADPKFQKDYKAEYKKMKAKLALLEAGPSSSLNLKNFQLKNKGLVTKTFNWDEEEVFNDEEVTQVKVLMAVADDELTVGKSHARNGEWVDITIRKINTLLSMDGDDDWQNYLNYINIDLNEQISHQKKKVLGGELFTETSSKMNENKNLFVPASMGIIVPESQAVNESLESTETLNTPESSKDSEAESLNSLHPLKILLEASPSSEE
nr:retrovirus-related Pol polyprotein from transposon TNT 1-94 [Tanacetum cinerariifolium]